MVKLKIFGFISLVLFFTILVASRNQFFLAFLDSLKIKSFSYEREIRMHQGNYQNTDQKVVWNSKKLNIQPPKLSFDSNNAKKVLAVDANTWIDINLSTQTLCLNQNGSQNCFLVSTGLWALTPTGTFAIWTKLPSTLMRGPGYYLPGVPWTMYFYKGYGIHGTYWHNNFGHPMSHGCVNMRTSEAQFVYDRVSVGTQVVVHY